MDIKEIAQDCAYELLKEKEVSIDDIYATSHKAVEEIVSDIALEIRDILEAQNIKIND